MTFRAPVGAEMGSPAFARMRPPHVALILVLLAAAALRLVHLGAPPTDFSITRQYNDVLLAHSFYAERAAGESATARRIAALDRPSILEVPILESATTVVDLLIGHETLVFPRLVSIFVWIMSGWTLWAIAIRLMSELAALVAVGIFELLPRVVVASRSFQPDPLAVGALLISVLLSLRWSERPSTRRLIAAAAAAGLAVWVKEDFAPFVLAVQAAAAWTTARADGDGGPKEHLRALIRPALALYALIALLPGLAWTLFGFSSSMTLSAKVHQYFIAGYLTDRSYWTGVWHQLAGVITAPVLALALVGLVMARGRLRAVLVMIIPAYLVFAVAFDYRVATHDYYQLPLVGFAALAAGHAVERIVGWVATRAFSTVLLKGLAVASIAAVCVVVLDVDRLPSTADAGPDIAKDRVVGAALCHPLHAIFLSPAYGLLVEYYGDVAGTAWPNPSDLALSKLQGQPTESAFVRLAALRASGSRYVIATDLRFLQVEPDLVPALAPYPLVLTGRGYRVWDLQPADPSACAGGPS